ncbi:MAG: aryl-sulfate sulfotransferase [Lachnospiraceae bacterium]|nr:aryl-sulfate sulfotransferase [Lachnospiraceae bacterium]
MKRNMITIIIVALIAVFTSGCGGKETAALSGKETGGLPAFSVKGETDLSGNFFLSFAYSRNIIMLDAKGNMVWSKHEEPLKEGSPTGFWDFKKHVVNGKTYYSYHDHTGTYDDYGLAGFAPGERVILDESFNEIKRITFEESDTVEKGHPLDGHDFLMIDPDHYILSGYIKETVYNHPDHPDGSSVVCSYLQEVKDGKAVWDFKSTDYPELYSLVVTDAVETADDFANEKTDAPDIIHFNAMRLDDEGNLICSFRHISSILCLDRSRKTDQIKWKLSGAGDDFGLKEDEKTSCQHYVTVDGSSVMVFDNGNRTKETKIRIYSLDAEKRSVSSVKTLRVDGKFSSACGDVQHLYDDTYMIGWGKTDNDAVCMSVYDFSEDKELMSVTLENPKNFTYRCVYYD